MAVGFGWGFVGVVGMTLGCLSWDFCADYPSGLLCFFSKFKPLGADRTMYLYNLLDRLSHSIMTTSQT